MRGPTKKDGWMLSNKAAPPKQTHEEIADQTAAFLAKGGTIKEIPSGVSAIESFKPGGRPKIKGER